MLAQTPDTPGGDTTRDSESTSPAVSDASKATDIGANAATKAPNNVAPADVAFMQTLTIGNLAEIDLGKLAAQRASDPEVQAFARRMVVDHSKTNDKLKAIAEPRRINLPVAPDAEHAAKKAKLEKVTGPNFDVAYMDEQVSDHQKATLAVQHQIDGGQDRDVRQLAIDTLPVVNHHLETARRLQAKLKGIVPAPTREPGG